MRKALYDGIAISVRWMKSCVEKSEICGRHCSICSLVRTSKLTQTCRTTTYNVYSPMVLHVPHATLFSFADSSNMKMSATHESVTRLQTICPIWLVYIFMASVVKAVSQINFLSFSQQSATAAGSFCSWPLVTFVTSALRMWPPALTRSGHIICIMLI